MVAEFATDLIENRPWLDDRARLSLSTPARDRSRQLGRQAVVVGAGIGGLAAAGALAQYFERVEILERDRVTAAVGSRSGTPQDRHPHGLLAGGLRALDQIFPGFERDLAAAGAVPVTFARDVQFERPDVGVRKDGNEAHMRFLCRADGVAWIAPRVCPVRLP